MVFNIDVKYIRPVTKLKHTIGGDWIDLRAGEDITLKAGEFALIPLGIAMRLPVGYEAIVAPRSSTFMKYGIIQTNSVGVIDGAYCGDNDEWMMPVYAVRDTVIPFDTRICQFRVIEHGYIDHFTEVEHLRSVDRGGFGSTGER